ncbi:retrovirus-related pol polyprotein from transposon TNT 1-94 [Tanacetum coccineum]
MCDKKNKDLFTDTECLVLSSDFKLHDENQVLLRITRQNNMYSFNIENIVPSGGLACLIAKATIDESNKWHRRDIIEFCGSKGIKREYSNARTPQQNRVVERKNMTLIEAARTMLADSFLPNTFWAEAVSAAYYVLNRVLVTKPQNKTPYELITGKIPIISYIRPFGCHVTIDYLGKFEGKSDEGFLVGYFLNNKAFRPVRSENQANKTAGSEEANHSAGTQDNINAGNSEMEADPAQDYFKNEEPVDQEDQAFLEEIKRLKRQEKEANDAAGVDEEEVLEEPDSTKVKVKQEGNTKSTRKRPDRRLKMKATKKSRRQKTDSDLEEEEQQKAFLMIVPDKEGEIDYEVLDKTYPIVDWESKFYHTDRYGKPHDYYRVFRADGSSRYIKTFTEMVSRFYRLDFIKGSLRTMFEANAEGIDQLQKELINSRRN